MNNSLKLMRKLCCKLKVILISALILTLSFSIACAGTEKLTGKAQKINFTDVANNHWAYSCIHTLVENGSIKGYNDGSFKPNKSVTYGEFLAIVTRLVCPEAIPEIEQAQHWAYPNLVAAVETGMMYEGYLETSQLGVLDTAISREHMAEVLVRAAAINGEEPYLYANIRNNIRDNKSISKLYMISVYEAYSMGLLTGDNNGNFNPQKSATRAEISTVFCKLMNYVDRPKVTIKDNTNRLTGVLVFYGYDPNGEMFFVTEDEYFYFESEEYMLRNGVSYAREYTPSPQYEVLDYLPSNSSGWTAVEFWWELSGYTTGGFLINQDESEFEEGVECSEFYEWSLGCSNDKYEESRGNAIAYLPKFPTYVQSHNLFKSGEFEFSVYDPDRYGETTLYVRKIGDSDVDETEDDWYDDEDLSFDEEDIEEEPEFCSYSYVDENLKNDWVWEKITIRDTWNGSSWTRTIEGYPEYYKEEVWDLSYEIRSIPNYKGSEGEVIKNIVWVYLCGGLQE